MWQLGAMIYGGGCDIHGACFKHRHYLVGALGVGDEVLKERAAAEREKAADIQEALDNKAARKKCRNIFLSRLL